ncbi:hypothetical protein RJ60_11695 [Mesotoga sp. B105.6.4]|nr:hypothetical protein RJ60_11695 [Mesotoga sp. B105.6.4]
MERFAALTREEREPVTGEMRRKTGKDRAGTQGWRRSRQVAMPGEASGDASLASAGSDLKASHLRWPVFASQRPVSPSARPVPAAPGKHRQSRKRTSRGSLRSREKRESQSLVK